MFVFQLEHQGICLFCWLSSASLVGITAKLWPHCTCSVSDYPCLDTKDNNFITWCWQLPPPHLEYAVINLLWPQFSKFPETQQTQTVCFSLSVMSKWVSAAHVSSVFSFSVSAAVYCTSVGAVGLMSLSVCWRDRERKEHHCAPAHSLTATYRCSAVAMDTVPSLSPLSCLSVGMEGWGSKGEERSGSGCCLCVIFIPVQLRAPPPPPPSPLPPLISPLPPPPASFLPSLPPSFLLIIQFAHY